MNKSNKLLCFNRPLFVVLFFPQQFMFSLRLLSVPPLFFSPSLS